MMPRRWGHFEILRRLGRSMTDVYLALDLQGKRTVVLKVIENCHDPVLRLTVEAEARGARIQQQLRTQNPHILAVYDWGELEGCFFVALEYFPGRTMAAVLASDGKLLPPRAARYAAAVCRQLQTLHGYQVPGGVITPIVHGDIKPSNIQIGVADEVRLLDFGIAKTIRPGHDLTQHQLGSPSYCSPERLERGEVSVAADLWALGVTLYESIAGTLPFVAENTRELERIIRSGQVPPALPVSCTPELSAIVQKALARDPRERYGTAGEFEDDLERFLADASTREQTAAVARAASGEVTVQRKEPVAVPKSRRTADRYTLAAALLAGLLAGFALFLPAAEYARFRSASRDLAISKDYASLPRAQLAADWQRYQTAIHRAAWFASSPRAQRAEKTFRESLLKSANKVIESYTQGARDAAAVDWEEARLFLLYAREIEPNNRLAEGELHLCNGFLRSRTAPAAAVKEFERARVLLPHYALPHLGLARVYAGAWHNPAASLAEFRAAQACGYRLGAREWEQQAHAYLIDGEHELAEARANAAVAAKSEAARRLMRARRDFASARALYQSIGQFSRGGGELERASQGEVAGAKLGDELARTSRLARRRSHLMLLDLRWRTSARSERWP